VILSMLSVFAFDPGQCKLFDGFELLQAGQIPLNALLECERVCTPDMSDPDLCMRCPLLDMRHTFLEMSQYRSSQISVSPA
jgi:hypothetical protein